jgi:ubiquinone/menaquinone biosynthesis C-methylase UbiE
MNKNELNSIVEEFTKAYWIKPVDTIWNSVNCWYVKNLLGNIKGKKILDLGSGDGLTAAVMFGGKIHPEYDRFRSAQAVFTRINPDKKGNRSGQFGDIYSRPIKARLIKKPKVKINYALELKKYHNFVSKSLGIYENIIQSSFNDIKLPDNSVDKVYSIFAFYWGDNIQKQLLEVNRVLKKDGDFIVNLPSEHLKKIHHAYNLSKDKKISKNLREMLAMMDGNRKNFVSYHGKSIPEWKKIFKNKGFKIVQVKKIINEKLFFTQDIVQRFFLPSLIEFVNKNKNILKYRNKIVEVHKRYLDDLLKDELNIKDRHGYYTIKFKKIR